MKGEISMKKTKWKKLIATFVMLVLMFQLTTNVGNASNEVKYNRKQLQDIYLDNLMRAVKKSDKLDESKYKIRKADRTFRKKQRYGSGGSLLHLPVFGGISSVLYIDCFCVKPIRRICGQDFSVTQPVYTGGI